MSDILETRTGAGTTFKALTKKAAAWMSDHLGQTEYTFRYANGAEDFRKYAHAAKLTISTH